jgi:HK97 family phage prohead protease
MPNLSAIEYKTIPFELKGTSSDGHGTFEGVGAAFHNIDAVGDIIAPGAFKDSLPEFLAEGFIGGQDHNWTSPIGHPYEAREVDGGLYIKAVFDNTPEAQATRAKMTVNPISGRATIKQLSIGYKAIGPKQLSENEVKSYWDAAKYNPSPLDIERAKSGARLLSKIKTYEVSPVLAAANGRALIHGVKSAATAGFAEHSQMVASALRESLDVVAEFFKRFERRAEVRFKEGRELSAANWSAMKDVHDSHCAMCDEHVAIRDKMAAILERTKPKDKGAPATPDAKTSPEPIVESAIDLAAVMAQYAQTMYATNPAFDR